MNDKAKIIRDRERMCQSLDCDNCGLSKGEPCSQWVFEHPEETVEIVEEWAKAHPIKTRADVFLERYPKGNPFDICPNLIDGTGCDRSRHFDGEYYNCDCCTKDYWSQEVEE